MDLFGINNVYCLNNGITFNNLPRHIMKDGFTDFSPKGISSFFSFRFPILNLTMFKDIQKFDCSAANITNSWKPVFNEIKISLENAISNTEILLIESIAKLVENKKRIGISLSGGLDSSLILAILKNKFQDKEIFTYSIGFCGEDEFCYSRLASSLFSYKHWEKTLSLNDFFGDDSILEDLIAFKCAPLHPNELPLAIAYRQAKNDNCEIVLCGEGADDIFGGYGNNLRMYLEYDDSMDYAEFLLKRYRYYNINEIRYLINDKYLFPDIDLLQNIFSENNCPNNARNKMFYFIQRVHTRGLIERGVNALSYNGFQPGFPYIDSALVTFVNSLPFDYKLRWKDGYSDKIITEVNYKEISENFDIPKYLLKIIAEEYLPKDIIYRPKYGFPVPFHLWLENVREYELDNLVFKNNDLSNYNGWKKFMIINLQIFIKHFKIYKKY